MRGTLPATEGVQVSGVEGGLTVVTKEMAHMESVAMGLWVGVGSRYETRGNNGISHFLEHLLFKGTKQRSQKQITRAIEGVGGSLNGFTSEEYTCYLAKVGSRHWREALDVLMEMYLDPRLAPGDIEKEKSVILQEISMYRDSPSHYVFELLGAVLWPAQPLGFMIIGTPDSVSGLSRSDFTAYMERAYSWKNTVLAVAGRIGHAEAVEEARKHVRDNRRSSLIAMNKAVTSYRRPGVQVEKRETEQTHLAMGVRAFGRSHPDRYALKLLSVILGENMSSRLFQQIRERHGLAYAISTTVQPFKDTGAVTLSAGMKNERTAKAVSLIVGELRRVKEHPVSMRELNRAKEYCVMQLLLSLEKTTNSMYWLGESMLCLGRVRSVSEVVRDLRAVTPDDIRRVANVIFRPGRLALAAIGPAIDTEELRGIARGL